MGGKIKQLTIVQVCEPGRLNVRGDASGCHFSHGWEHGCYILTSSFMRTELWVFLKTKSSLKWDICKLMLCGDRKKKNTRRETLGNRVEVSPKYEQGKPKPWKLCCPRPGPGWPNIKDLCANNGLAWWLSGEEPSCQSRRHIRDACLIPGSGSSPGGEHGNPVLYPCLETPMDRGARKVTVPRVAEACLRRQHAFRQAVLAMGHLPSWLVNWPVLGLQPVDKAQKDNRVRGMLKTYRQMSGIQDCLARVISRGSGLLDPSGLPGAGGDRTIGIRAQEKTPRRTGWGLQGRELTKLGF